MGGVSSKRGGRGHRGRDLFGRRVSPEHLTSDAIDRIALSLREISERALQAGLGRSSCLIEIAALVVELEADIASHDEAGL